MTAAALCVPSLRPRLAVVSLLLALAALPARAGEVFAKPPSATGGVNASAWVPPDGSDSDMYAWDDFTLAATQTVTEVRWRGGYAAGAPFGKATDFRVSFFESIAGGFQPLITAMPEDEENEVTLATFHINGNAGETFAGVFSGVSMYDYRFVLPAPVTLAGGVKYWFRVVASQPVYPDWGLTTSSPGSHFRYSTGLHMFQNVPNEMAFALHATWADLGHALAGTAGLPKLSGGGALSAGSACALALSGARPSSAVTLVFGTSVLGAPFKGGQLVPAPLGLVVLSSDPAGSASLPFVMPPGLPAGTTLVLQAWISDPAAVHGLSASNGLSGTTP